jgi:hypothetical protein
LEQDKLSQLRGGGEAGQGVRRLREEALTSTTLDICKFPKIISIESHWWGDGEDLTLVILKSGDWLILSNYGER